MEEAEIQGVVGESGGSSCLVAGIERRAVNLRLDLTLTLTLEDTKGDETSVMSMSDSLVSLTMTFLGWVLERDRVERMIITSSSSLDGGEGSELRLRLDLRVDLRIGSGEGEVVVIVEIMTVERRREGIFTLNVEKVGSEIKMGEF